MNEYYKFNSLPVKPLERVRTACAEAAGHFQIRVDVLGIDDWVADSLFGPFDGTHGRQTCGGVAHQAALLLVQADVQFV